MSATDFLGRPAKERVTKVDRSSTAPAVEPSMTPLGLAEALDADMRARDERISAMWGAK